MWCQYAEPSVLYNIPVAICKVTNSTCFTKCDKKVDAQRICYNCKHWLGSGDWGLSCRKNYYIATSNGFNEACEEFEVKENA